MTSSTSTGGGGTPKSAASSPKLSPDWNQIDEAFDARAAVDDERLAKGLPRSDDDLSLRVGPRSEPLGPAGRAGG